MVDEKTLVIALGVACVVGILLFLLFNSYLRRRHPDVWDSLGSPGLIRNNSLRETLLFLKFLFRREYLKVNDVRLHRLAQASLVWFVFYILFFISILFLTN
jgi:hypothetical protein